MKTSVFVYHTLQFDYPLYHTMAPFLGDPVGRYRSVQPYPMTVSVEPVCYNPRCGFDHRICAMVDAPGKGLRVEGDLYELDEEQLRLLDAEEYHFPGEADEDQGSLRREIELEPIDGGERITVQTHFNNYEVDGFYEVIEAGHIELIPLYTAEMAQQVAKSCCVESPGHEGAHRVPERHHDCDDHDHNHDQRDDQAQGEAEAAGGA